MKLYAPCRGRPFRAPRQNVRYVPVTGYVVQIIYMVRTGFGTSASVVPYGVQEIKILPNKRLNEIVRTVYGAAIFDAPPKCSVRTEKNVSTDNKTDAKLRRRFYCPCFHFFRYVPDILAGRQKLPPRTRYVQFHLIVCYAIF